MSVFAQKAETTEDGKSPFEAVQELIVQKDKEYACSFLLSPQLDRRLVSFQANKKSPIYRLFKYKEGFSAALVSYFIDTLDLYEGPILDPFSGTGTTSLVASSKGIASTGIELLPIGNLIAEAREEIVKGLHAETIERITFWRDNKPWVQGKADIPLNELKITKGAYSKKTEKYISRYLSLLSNESKQAQVILKFALCSILEEVSFTRKDGQFLRWDHRSGRRAGQNSFDKGRIYEFNEAIETKLTDICSDAMPQATDQFPNEGERFDGNITLIDGTCLAEMQKLESGSFQSIITSPPYCNRYDYTRTYALELAALGIQERELVKLRQTMLSCTVENRKKDLLLMNKKWEKILSFCEKHDLLNAINDYLLHLKSDSKLNNNGIPRMIDGYFKEMACIIYECARVLKSGGYMLMVNDNVRYSGASIPVDAILSDFAKQCGMEVENILVLPTGKGNSSQQMGEHGRSVLRKCVYVWRKK